MRPELVAEVEFVEWTQDGKLRHGKFVGMKDGRSDAGRRRDC